MKKCCNCNAHGALISVYCLVRKIWYRLCWPCAVREGVASEAQ